MSLAYSLTNISSILYGAWCLNSYFFAWNFCQEWQVRNSLDTTLYKFYTTSPIHSAVAIPYQMKLPESFTFQSLLTNELLNDAILIKNKVKYYKGETKWRLRSTNNKWMLIVQCVNYRQTVWWWYRMKLEGCK